MTHDMIMRKLHLGTWVLVLSTVLNNVIGKIGYGSVAHETSIFVVVCCVISLLLTENKYF